MLVDILKDLWPIVAVQTALQVFALINLSRRNKVRFDNKWIWVAIIVLGGVIGSIAYFYFRGDEYEDSSED